MSRLSNLLNSLGKAGAVSAGNTVCAYTESIFWHEPWRLLFTVLFCCALLGRGAPQALARLV